MRRLACILMMSLVLICPGYVSAAEFKLNINIVRQEDSITYGELLYNDRVIWRLAFSPDGIKPVLGGNGTKTTLVTPEIANGLFLLKVNSI